MNNKLNIIHIIGRYWKIFTTIFNFSFPLLYPSAELIKCTVDDDCPRGGQCFKDECARCLCPQGHEVINLYHENKLIKICQKRATSSFLIGGHCYNDSHKHCPTNSHCDITQNICFCDNETISHRDWSFCRHRLYGELCSNKARCEENLGLKCKGRTPTCKCLSSHHRPSKWTRHVLRRWDYSRVNGEPQECIARVVGEPCHYSRDCADIYGSGAICNNCKFCACKIKGHVPDVLGTRCGPALDIGEACSLNSEYICDGTKGLQCGDVCSIYEYDFSKKTCSCSQMHDKINDQCVQKSINSPCVTDLDCYPIQEGYGVCDKGQCIAYSNDVPEKYESFMVDRFCADDEKVVVDFNTSQLPKQTNRQKTKKDMSDFEEDYETKNYQMYASKSQIHFSNYFQVSSFFLVAFTLL